MPSNQEAVIYECNCQCEGESTCCDANRCYPYVDETFPGNCTGASNENPLPIELTVEITSDSPYGCWTLSDTVTLLSEGRWGLGQLTGTCTFCCPGNSASNCTWTFDTLIQVQCGISGGWLLEFDFASSGPTTVQPPVISIVLTRVSCNPILLTGELCFNPGMTCAGLMPPVGNGQTVTHPDICFDIVVSEIL